MNEPDNPMKIVDNPTCQQQNHDSRMHSPEKVTMRKSGTEVNPSITRKKSRKQHRKKQKLIRPCSPASYPSPLPIMSGVFDDSTEDEAEVETKTKKRVPSTKTNSIVRSQDDNVKVEKKPLVIEATNNTDKKKKNIDEPFLAFRIHYLIVHIAIMLADGLQGTHLYILYEGYGYTVASLYCLGFVSGAVTSPFIGPLVDKVGRRNSAVAYCVMEIIINMLEQYDALAGLILSRVVGGITTNLLFTVFESWLVTEHRRRGFSEEKLETVLRDSVVASNISAIASGCLAHLLALHFGAKGPFEGAVACTFVALVLVTTRWEENYGSDVPGVKSISHYMSEAFTTITSDSKIYRIGLIQGLTEGALQTFVFLWSPTLHHFASKLRSSSTPTSALGLDSDGEPAYGLIFGAFMACGALGGMLEPSIRKMFVNFIYSAQDHTLDITNSAPTATDVKQNFGEKVKHSEFVPRSRSSSPLVAKERTQSPTVSSMDGLCDTSDVTFEDDSLPSRISEVPEEACDSDYETDSEQNEDEKPVAVELLASLCFFTSAGLLATPVFVDENSPYAFTASLIAFLMYEAIVGLYMPCEGVLRSIYMPNDSICSLMTMLRVIVNVAVALGVISTNYIPFTTAFAACSGALIIAALLQLSLVQTSEWALLKNAILKFFGLGNVSNVRNSASSDDIIQINSSLKLGDLSISSPMPGAKRLSDSIPTSPALSVSSFTIDEQCESDNQRDTATPSVEPVVVPAKSQQGNIRRRIKSQI